MTTTTGASSAPNTPPQTTVEGGAQPSALVQANAALTTNPHMMQASNFLAPSFEEPFFGCFTDTTGCLLACCCPCVPMAALKANLDGRQQTLLDYICCPNPYQLRQTLRSRHHIPMAPFNDCIAVCCCPCCAIHVDVREYARREGKPPQFMMPL